MKIAVGFGSSLGPRTAHIRRAVHALARLDGLTHLRSSSLYRTPPMKGGVASGWFMNAVATYESALQPHDVLRHCQRLERSAGRRRARHWGDRTLDLDVLLAEGLAIDTPDLTLPHRGIHKRAFVLDPLIEIWPDAINPETGLPYSLGGPAPGPRAVRVAVLARHPRLVTSPATPTT